MDQGRLSLTRQGTAGDFPSTAEPVLPLSPGELQAYHQQLGTYWQDAGFTPDFPRAAQLWSAHWRQRFPDTPIRGVIAIDPVALSYVLDGTGPVKVGDVELTTDNAIEELLNGMDLDHLVGHRLHPNRVAIGFRLLARNLAIGLQIRDADARPAVIREPAAFRAEHVDGLGTFTPDDRDPCALLLSRYRPTDAAAYPLPWTNRIVRLVA